MFYRPVTSAGVCGAFVVDVCRNSGQQLVSDGAGLPRPGQWSWKYGGGLSGRGER